MLFPRLLAGCCLGLTLVGSPALAQTTASDTPTAPLSAISAQPTASVQLPLPQASPHVVLQQALGLATVTVDYHAPGVKGRPVWGQLVPWDEVWRAGANENTILTFSDTLTVNGQVVPAGQYSFYVLPHAARDWELILNRVTTHWGSEGYDPKDDLVRLPIASEPAPFHETLLYWFSDVVPAGGKLNLTWEKRTVSLLIESDVHGRALAGITQTLTQNPGNWQLLAQAAEYLVQNNMQAELALRYINESIRLHDVYSNNWIKARLLASQKDYTTAIEFGRKALKMGDKNDVAFKNQLPDMRVRLTEWQGKAY
ncbi:DUF2911 domain-containing protein [Hymenobacter cavernae]|uniref:DUF2911 domain-containing protein n=1 Tax=Hymenobacter cavernae TaxID=2044852 RepID=UPI001662C857|nr:DUF2911 domain-containing protein [Hymenobacter cavernae]